MKRDLPPRLHFKDGGYYHVAKNKWTFLGSHRKAALKRHIRIEHGLPPDGPEPSWVSMPKYLMAKYRAAKARSIGRGIHFDLMPEQFEKIVARAGGSCEVTRIPFDLNPIAGSDRRPWAPSLDRINSADHYHFANCRLVCCIVNWAMSDWGEAVFWKLVRHARREIRDRRRNNRDCGVRE